MLPATPATICACAIAVASIAAAGCGETTIDGAKATKFIGKTVKDQAGVNVKSVTCPENVKAVKGDTFNCTVLAKDGTKGTVKVEQKDGKGNVFVSAPFLHPRDIEAAIVRQIKQQLSVTVTATCPEIVTPRAGEKFSCDATDGKRTRRVESTITDDNGSLRFRLL